MVQLTCVPLLTGVFVFGSRSPCKVRVPYSRDGLQASHYPAGALLGIK